MKAADVIKLVVQYHANVLSGDASQMVQLAHYISTLSAEERAAVKINKIIYTSEGLAPSQRDFILSVLGPVEICSILGSAEAGPFAVSCPHLIDAEPVGQTPSYRDFVYDTRLTLIEVVRPQEPGDRSPPVLLGPNEFGMIVQTSFSRLKHPLVRYVTGDIGAVRELPEHARPRILQKNVPYLRVLRLQGRDHRFSFPWDGDYIEFDGLAAILDEPGHAVLQWQVVLDKMETAAEAAVEVRLLRPSVEGAERPSGENLEGRVRTYFKVTGENEHRFKIVYVDDLDGFVRSGTGRKVTKFVNRLD
jgi:phenylacetate-coenzyme A ligase PaaK-like adenylate-forming protein